MIAAIVLQIDELDEDAVLALELGTGVPLVYDLAEDGTVRDKHTLE